MPDSPSTPAIKPAAAPATLENVVVLLAAIRDRLDAGPAELLDAASAAQLYCVSRSKFLDLDTQGYVPLRIELGDGRCPRWSRSECMSHIRAGCPHRVRWVMLKDAAMRRSA